MISAATSWDIDRTWVIFAGLVEFGFGEFEGVGVGVRAGVDGSVDGSTRPGGNKGNRRTSEESTSIPLPLVSASESKSGSGSANLTR